MSDKTSDADKVTGTKCNLLLHALRTLAGGWAAVDHARTGAAKAGKENLVTQVPCA